MSSGNMPYHTITKVKSPREQKSRDRAISDLNNACSLRNRARWQLPACVGFLLVAVLLTACSDSNDATESAPALEPVTVIHPPEEGKGMANAARVDLAAAGYVEEEFFFEGTATSYKGDDASG